MRFGVPFDLQQELEFLNSSENPSKTHFYLPGEAASHIVQVNILCKLIT